MYHSSLKLFCIAALGFLFGIVAFVEWMPIFMVRNSPVVGGKVVQRQPIHQWGVPRVDFTIAVDDSKDVIHAFGQRYLIDNVPENVRFHYTGDSAREVLLFEHEEDPFWIMVFVWGGSAFLLSIVIYRFVNASVSPPTQL